VLETCGLADVIDEMVFSNEAGVCKPQRAIFDTLVDALGVKAHEALFVGDNIDADVHGARAAGLRAVHFNPPQKGVAFAPFVDRGETFPPDATIACLSELPAVIAAMS
jgi:FMN phosphatase YigB (HAD superfamily)